MGCLLQFFLFWIILAFIGAVRIWWQMRRMMNAARKQHQRQTHQQQNQRSKSGVYMDETKTQSKQSKKKVFDDDEGEYVDFEEIK